MEDLAPYRTMVLNRVRHILTKSLELPKENLPMVHYPWEEDKKELLKAGERYTIVFLYDDSEKDEEGLKTMQMFVKVLRESSIDDFLENYEVDSVCFGSAEEVNNLRFKKKNNEWSFGRESSIGFPHIDEKIGNMVEQLSTEIAQRQDAFVSEFIGEVFEILGEDIEVNFENIPLIKSTLDKHGVTIRQCPSFTFDTETRNERVTSYQAIRDGDRVFLEKDCVIKFGLGENNG